MDILRRSPLVTVLAGLVVLAVAQAGGDVGRIERCRARYAP